jgi:hypothetical protein
MKVKNIVRKAVALGSGAALVGTTLMGAFAYDLSTYPSKYIVDGRFDGKIVVGERAATADVLGSIDIAASLQGASVSKVALPGQAGRVSLSGESVFEIGTGSDQIELREPLGDVVDTITSTDLPGLRSGRITTSEGTTEFNQYLRLKDGTNLQNMTVNYVEDDDGRNMMDYMVVDTDSPFIEWEIQFPDGLESEVESDGSMEDLEDRSFNIMGTDFSIVRATITSGDNVELTMMGGSVPDTLREGETKTYDINGVPYEVTLVFVSDPNSGGNPEVKFSVNGEITQSLSEGDTDTLSGGTQIGVRDILVNAREGVASFFLGADKVVFTDNTATVSDDFDGDVEINNDNINDGDVTILGANTSGSTKFEITSIKYRITMDAADGSVAFVPKGKGVKEFMDKPESLISDSLDIKYEGLTAPETTEVSIIPSGDDRYRMTFTNIQGGEYTFPLLSNKDGTWKFGDQNDEFIFVEGTATTDYFIGRNDYFAVSNDRGANDADKAVSHVLRYEDYDTSEKTLQLEDQSTGSTVSVAISGAANGPGTGSLVVGGHTFSVYVQNVSSTEPFMAVDLNADNDVSSDKVTLTAWGGLIIDLATVAQLNNTVNLTSGAALSPYVRNNATLEGAVGDLSNQFVIMNGKVLAKNFDTSSNGDELFNWSISEVASGNEVDITFSSSAVRGPNKGSLADVNEFQFNELEEDDDYNVGMTDYGILIKEYDPTGNNPNELILEVPKTQRFGQVFVTLGDVTASESGAGGTADRVNPIAVGLAISDADAAGMVGRENLIVVGGPCANTIAAELLGNPAECGEGFEPGKAMIQSWDKGSTVAILVAGYESTETVGASRVLAAYQNYDLTGTEVEVVVADLNSIRVTPMG